MALEQYDPDRAVTPIKWEPRRRTVCADYSATEGELYIPPHAIRHDGKLFTFDEHGLAFDGYIRLEDRQVLEMVYLEKSEWLRSVPGSPHAHWKQAYIIPLGWWQAQCLLRNLPGEGSIDLLKQRIKKFEVSVSKGSAEYRPWKELEKQFSKEDFEKQNSSQRLNLWESLTWDDKFAKDAKRMLEECFTHKVPESDTHTHMTGTQSSRPTENTQIHEQRTRACFFLKGPHQANYDLEQTVRDLGLDEKLQIRFTAPLPSKCGYSRGSWVGKVWRGTGFKNGAVVATSMLALEEKINALCKNNEPAQHIPSANVVASTVGPSHEISYYPSGAVSQSRYANESQKFKGQKDTNIGNVGSKNTVSQLPTTQASQFLTGLQTTMPDISNNATSTSSSENHDVTMPSSINDFTGELGLATYATLYTAKKDALFIDAKEWKFKGITFAVDHRGVTFNSYARMQDLSRFLAEGLQKSPPFDWWLAQCRLRLLSSAGGIENVKLRLIEFEKMGRIDDPVSNRKYQPFGTLPDQIISEFTIENEKKRQDLWDELTPAAQLMTHPSRYLRAAYPEFRDHILELDENFHESVRDKPGQSTIVSDQPGRARYIGRDDSWNDVVMEQILHGLGFTIQFTAIVINGQTTQDNLWKRRGFTKDGAVIAPTAAMKLKLCRVARESEAKTTPRIKREYDEFLEDYN